MTISPSAVLNAHTDRFRELLRKKIHPALFFLFNVTFISLIQNVLLFLITTPTYVILLVSRVNDTMDKVDIAFARVMMVLILIEFFADQQQWGKHITVAKIIVYYI